jgi:hypothetical protein
MPLLVPWIPSYMIGKNLINFVLIAIGKGEIVIARQTTLLAAVFVIVVTVVGCGDDSGSAASGDGTLTTSSLSKTQFVKQANAACHDEKAGYSGKIEASLRKVRSEGLSEHDAAIRTVQTVLLPIAEAQIAAIREMGVPAGDKEEVEAALNAQQKAVDGFNATEPEEVGENPASYFVDATKELQDYGLTACVISLS